MNNHEMIYQPFQIYSGFIRLLQIVWILLSAVLGMAIQQNAIEGVVIAGILLVSDVFLMKMLYDLVNVTVIFDREGVRLLNAGKIKQHWISWENISYGYYCKNWHGNLYLVLSPNVVEQRKLKKMVNQCSNSLALNIYINECIVIAVDSQKQMEQVDKVVRNKIVTLKKV